MHVIFNLPLQQHCFTKQQCCVKMTTLLLFNIPCSFLYINLLSCCKKEQCFLYTQYLIFLLCEIQIYQCSAYQNITLLAVSSTIRYLWARRGDSILTESHMMASCSREASMKIIEVVNLETILLIILFII